jgi:hypothetical protein
VCFAAREQSLEDGPVADYDREKSETGARLEYSDRLSQLGQRSETGGSESEKSITTELSRRFSLFALDRLRLLLRSDRRQN